MRFEAPVFAKAWLAVALASGTDKMLSTLHKTVAIEVYDTGVRLLATDRYILLTAWVPDLDTSNDSMPDVADAPLRTVVAADLDSRGKSLLTYTLTLWRRMLDSEGMMPEGEDFDVNIEFDQRMPNDAEAGTFEGMESRYVILDVPDTERVWLQTVESDYPDWRHLVREHEAETTKVIHLNPERLQRLGKIRQYTAGSVAWTFGGSERPALIRVGEPDIDGFEVEGVIMPTRWITEYDPEPDPDDGEPDPDPEPEDSE